MHRTVQPIRRRALGATLAVLLGIGPMLVFPSPASAAPADVTADVRANRNIVLAGDAVVRLTGGTVTYTGVISGTGTFTVSGAGTLVLTRDSDFTLPASRRRQTLVTYNGNHPLTRMDNPDPPAVIVEKGVTLQYGTGDDASGQITHNQAVPGASWNLLNIRVDGMLDIALRKSIHLGIMSGTGVIQQRRFIWTSLDLAGKHPFSGVIVVGSGCAYGSNAFLTGLPNIKTIINDGSAIHSSPNGVVTTSRADYYSRHYGNDINFHTWGSGVVRMTGAYSYFDRGSITDPKLSNASVNWTAIPHSTNKRGINIEGANVEWGDGTTSRFFLPGDEQTAYLNMHFDGRERSRLTLNYNGKVTLGLPISGGRYHDTLRDPGEGDVVIAATKGNHVTFTAPQNYNGSTTIGSGATLRLGDGTADGDSSLRLGGRYRIIDDGTLIVQNARKAISLSKISGSGSFRQAGTATTTLTGATTYRGATVIEKGTLRLTAGSLATSRGVDLAGPGATLDLRAAGPQTIKDLAGVAGTTVTLGGTLTVGTGASTTYAGSITGAGNVVKVGTGALTLAGALRTPEQAWTIREGTLTLAGTASVQAAVAVEGGGTLDAAGTVGGAVTSSGTVVPRAMKVSGDFVQKPGATLTAGGLTVSGSVELAGTLTIPADAAREASIVVIDNAGTDPVTGVFDGLPEGATVDGRTISYAGGDGNDVVLSPAPTGVGGRIPGAVTGGGGANWLTIAGAVAVLAGLAAVTVLMYRRRRPRGRRRASAT
jgi:autotransporter-associated beta strand protein